MLEPARRADVEQVLVEHGLSLERAGGEARAIALFGSRAAGCAREGSDWDLLCIGTGQSRKLGRVDLVWVDLTMTATPLWLGGDLAGHVAKYGVWLDGACPWRGADVQFDVAARRKEERIARKLRSLERVWDLLGPVYHDKHIQVVRRELQRLELLWSGVAVPPSAHLDGSWMTRAGRLAWLKEGLLVHGATPRLADAMIMQASG